VRERRLAGRPAIALVGVAIAALFVACVLNPHPLPPMEATSADSGAKASPSGDANAFVGADSAEATDATAPGAMPDSDAGTPDAASDASGADSADGLPAEGGIDAAPAAAIDAPAD
jgi:hypothetical protein